MARLIRMWRRRSMDNSHRLRQWRSWPAILLVAGGYASLLMTTLAWQAGPGPVTPGRAEPIPEPVTSTITSPLTVTVAMTGTVPTETVQLTTLTSVTVYAPLVNRGVWPATPFLPWINLAHPYALMLPYPRDGATGQSPNTYLSWEWLTPPTEPLSFEVILGINSAPPTQLAVSGLNRAVYDPMTFEPNTQIYWQVIVVDGQGQRITGPVWTFRSEVLLDPPDSEATVSVPAGEFRMGCDSGINPEGGCQHKDTPLHTVYLDAYAIDKYEVTNRQYRACVDAGVCRRPLRSDSKTRSTYFRDPTYDDFPVLFVSWWNAQDYCGWKGKRLPTEAEWEKAARGPVDTRTWPWGEEYPDCSRLNYTDDHDENDSLICMGDTVRVGSYPSGASPYGAMDMAGNAFEWVADRFDMTYPDLHYYAVSPYANPLGPLYDTSNREGPFFVLRGGSYRPRWSYQRVFHRHHGHRGDDSSLGRDIPLYRNDQVGFRCATPLPP